MSDTDLSVIIVLIFFGVLWLAFNGLYYSGEMQQKDFEQYNKSKEGSIADKARPSFLDFMFFDSDIAIVNQLIFIPLGAIVVVIGFRSIRGI